MVMEIPWAYNPEDRAEIAILLQSMIVIPVLVPSKGRKSGLPYHSVLGQNLEAFEQRRCCTIPPARYTNCQSQSWNNKNKETTYAYPPPLLEFAAGAM